MPAKLFCARDLCNPSTREEGGRGYKYGYTVLEFLHRPMATIRKRILADGTRVRYQAIIRLRGQRRKRQFNTRAKAVAWATKTEAAILNGEPAPTATVARRKVAEAIDAYLEAGVADKLRSKRDRLQHLTWWRARIGKVRLRDLDRLLIRRELEALEAGAGPRGRPASPGTRHRYLASLRSMLSWAVDEDLLTANPAAGAARKGKDAEPPGRVRYLTDDERQRLLDACERNSRLSALVRLALLTGMRRGELMELEWNRVDLGRGLVSLARAKAGPRAVALSSAAVAALRDLHGRRVLGWKRVFAEPPHGQVKFPRAAWKRALAEAGIKNFRFHDLRHCFASALLTAGGTLPELAAALGHRTLAMVARYAHLEKAHAAELVERVAERFT
jgi:integrase